VTDNANIGSPKGKIIIDDGDLARVRASVVDAAKIINHAFDSTDPHIQKMVGSLRTAEQAAKAFGDSDLGVIQRTVQSAAQSFFALSAASAALVVGGTAAAQSNRQLVTSYQAILNSASRAREELQGIRNLADEFKLPFLETAAGARGFLSVINSTDLTMRQLIITAQRLRLAAPEKSVAEASFSLRELLSGDAVSIVDNFNLSRSEINRIKNEANGDAQQTIAGLNEYLNRIGLTEEALLTMGESGANAFAILRSSVTEAMATAFEPLLTTTILPLAQGFANFLTELNQTNPALLQMGSIFVLAAAGVAPLLLAINQAIIAYRTLRIVAATPIGGAIGGAAARIGVGVAALEVGNQIGLNVARGLADNGIGDQRLRSDSGEDPGAVINERIRQVAVILYAAIGQLVNGILQGKFIVENAVDLIGTAFGLLGLKIQEAGSRLVEGIGALLIAFGEQFNIPQLTEFGTTIVDTMVLLREGRVRQVPAYDSVSGSPVTRFERVGGIRGSIEQAELRLSQGVNLTADQVTALQQSQDLITQHNIDFANTLGLMNDNAEEVATDENTGITPAGETLSEKLRRIADSPAWQDILDAIAANAENIRQANDERMLGAGREGEDFARGRMRSLADERKQDERLGRQQLEREAQAIAAIAAIRTEGAQRIADLLKKDQAGRERDFQDHNKNLLDIQRQGHVAITDAIADGDGAAAIRAVRNVEEQTRKEKEEYAERVKERNDDLKEQKDSLIAQGDERLRDAMAQLVEMRNDFAQQRAERDSDFQERLDREDEDRGIRLERDQADFERRRTLEDAENERRIVDMQTQFFTESGLLNTFQLSISDVFRRIRDDGIQYMNELWFWMRDGRGMIGGGGNTSDLPTALGAMRLPRNEFIPVQENDLSLTPTQEREGRRPNTIMVSISMPLTVLTDEPFNYEELISEITDRVTNEVAIVIEQVNEQNS